MTAIQPELWVEQATRAVEFYQAAFGATVTHQATADENWTCGKPSRHGPPRLAFGVARWTGGCSLWWPAHRGPGGRARSQGKDGPSLSERGYARNRSFPPRGTPAAQGPSARRPLSYCLGCCSLKSRCSVSITSSKHASMAANSEARWLNSRLRMFRRWVSRMRWAAAIRSRSSVE